MEYDIKPNLAIVGKKYGPMIPGIRKALAEADPSTIALKVKNEKAVKLDIGGEMIELDPEELLVEIKNRADMGVETDGEFTVGLSTDISEKLLAEGFVRELVHHIQNLRKEAGFEIENTIDTAIEVPADKAKIIEEFKDYINSETLTRNMLESFSDGMYIKEVKVNDSGLKIGIKVVGSII